MDHMSGNTSIMGSIEVPIHRSHPDEQSANFSLIFTELAGLKSAKNKKIGNEGSR
jgi:hypothetical protein